MYPHALFLQAQSQMLSDSAHWVCGNRFYGLNPLGNVVRVALAITIHTTEALVSDNHIVT